LTFEVQSLIFAFYRLVTAAQEV